VRFVIECSPFTNQRDDKLATVGAGESRPVDGLPTWVRWIIVTAFGLSPILTYWFAGVLGRYLRRKLPWRVQTDVSVGADRPGSTDKAN
jgi:hypothetical protein